MIRIGFIGAGNIASGHLAAVQSMQDVSLTAFLDPVVERAQERAAQFGGQAVTDLAALWERADAVWVCSPPHLHAEHAVAAARAGRHVFVEKPLAHTLEAADQILQEAQQAGITLGVGHVTRYTPAIRKMYEVLTSGDLGDLVACWSRRFGETSPAELPWWRRDWRRGGGFTIEWGISELELLRWLGGAAAGPITRVHGRTICSRGDYPDFDDYARATLTYHSGAVAGFEGGLIAPLGGGTSRALVGTRGMIVAEGRSLRLRYGGDGPERLLDVPPSTDPERRVSVPILEADAAFLRAVQESRQPEVGGEDGRAALALCLAIHRSSREQREIPLDGEQA